MIDTSTEIGHQPFLIGFVGLEKLAAVLLDWFINRDVGWTCFLGMTYQRSKPLGHQDLGCNRGEY